MAVKHFIKFFEQVEGEYKTTLETLDVFLDAAEKGELVSVQVRNLKRNLKKVKKSYTFFKKVADLLLLPENFDPIKDRAKSYNAVQKLVDEENKAFQQIQDLKIQVGENKDGKRSSNW